MLIPLRVYSEYSLLKSCIKANGAIDFCQKNNINTIAITDENNMFGALPWSLAMQKAQIKPIIGAELKLENNGYISAFCKNELGYQELSKAITKSYLEKTTDQATLKIEDIFELKNCFLLLDHTLESNFIEKLSLNKELEIGLAISRQKNEAEFENKIFNFSHNFNIPLVAAPKFYRIKNNEALAVDALMCIKNGTYLAEVDREKVEEDQYLENIQEIEKSFKDIPFAIENSLRVSQKCNFILKEHSPRMPKLDIEDPKAKMEEIVFENLKIKLEKFVFQEASEEEKIIIQEKYFQRAKYELEMISQMGFCDYFLIVSDIVTWAKENDIPVGPGRGSGASSLCAWLLNITNIDPLKFNLMFERFLNPDRVSLPDFDIDFCQQKRAKVIEYIQKRFGKENVAHIITFGSLQYRAAIRDVGRVMQLPYPFVDAICKKLPQPIQGVAPTIKELREKGELKDILNSDNEELFMIAETIEGAPRHSSVHAAGVVIGNEDLSKIVPLYKEEGLDIPIIQFAMKQAEQIGLVKFDILGLSVLSVLKKACMLIKETQNVEIDLDKIPLTDEKTFKMLEKGFVKAVFQVDSIGFKHLMMEMKPNCLGDLVAAGALYRPGPMADIPQFIKCKNDPKNAQYLYPQMESILKETYSVIVYQEQILEIAKEMANYSLKEADLLRRAVGKKIKSEMAKHKEKFIDGILKTCGGTKAKAETLFENLARFASYGFPKAHAAPYGLMTYQTGYLKANYTKEFICATLIYEHTQEKSEEIMQEAKKLNVTFLSPSINESEINFSLKNESIVYGLSKIKGIGEEAANLIVEERKKGKFQSIKDFIKRIDSNKRVLESLVYSGAFDCVSNLDRSKQFNELSNKNKELTISLFDIIDEAPNWNDIEIIKNEHKTMGTVYYKKTFNFNLEKYHIYNELDKIKDKGYLLAIGLTPNFRKTKDDKILISYKFLDKNGIQENLANKEHKIEWQKVIIKVEKTEKRYLIKNVIEESEFFNNFKKIFLTNTTKNEIKLKEGETSIYDENSNFIGNYKITAEFLNNMQEKITSLY